MTISLRTATGLTAASDTATPFANLTYTLPTGHTLDDLLVAIYGGKPYGTTPSTPTDYASLLSFASGTTGAGNGTGSVRENVFTKWHDGSESNPASTFSAGYDPGMVAMLAAYKTNPGQWKVEACKATAETTSLSVTGDATLSFEPGDLVAVIVVHRDDDPAETSPAITIPGCTIGSITEQLATNTSGTGNGGAMYLYTATVTAGTATGAPQFSATVSNSEGWVAVGFVRVHEPPDRVVRNKTIAVTTDNPATCTFDEGTALDDNYGLIALVRRYNGSSQDPTPTTPDGWDLIGGEKVGTTFQNGVWAYGKRGDGSTNSISISGVNGGSTIITLLGVSHVDSDTFWDTCDTTAGTGTTATVGPVTNSESDAEVLGFLGVGATFGNTPTWDRLYRVTGSQFSSSSWAKGVYQAASQSISATVSWSTSGSYALILVPLKTATKVSGTVAPAPPTASPSISATATVSGTVSKTVLPASPSITASATVSGTISETTETPSVSISGTVRVSGTFAPGPNAAEPDITGVVEEDEAVSGELSKTVLPAALSLSATVRVSGILSETALSPAPSVSGTARVSGTLSETASAPTVAAAGSVLVSGTISKTASSVSPSISASARISGTLSKTAGAASPNASGTVRVSGEISKTAVAAAPSVSATVRVSGELSKTTLTPSVDIDGEVEGGSGSFTPDPYAASPSIQMSVRVSGTMSPGPAPADPDLSGAARVSGAFAPAPRSPSASVSGLSGDPSTGALAPTPPTAAPSITASVRISGQIAVTIQPTPVPSVGAEVSVRASGHPVPPSSAPNIQGALRIDGSIHAAPRSARMSASASVTIGAELHVTATAAEFHATAYHGTVPAVSLPVLWTSPNLADLVGEENLSDIDVVANLAILVGADNAADLQADSNLAGLVAILEIEGESVLLQDGRHVIIKRGDTSPDLVLVCMDGDATVDLTVATSIHVVISKGGAVIVNSLETGTDKGVVSYSWSAEDTAEIADLLAEVKVLWPNGKIRTFPAEGQVVVHVVSDVS